MDDLADVYEATRISIRDLLESRPEEDLERPVPATPGWRVRDVVAHLVGDIECLTRGEFPSEFFGAIGDPAAVVTLNEWTSGHVSGRDGRSLQEMLKEWDEVVEPLLRMMRGQEPWPEGVLPLAEVALVTDLGVHQQDLNGAFGIERDRDSAPVKIGTAGYIAVMDMRLRSEGVGAVALEAPGKRWTAGGDEPQATVRASRFEFFRALSGRRSKEQLRSLEWEGDPEPFLDYFYPYGVREEALVE